MYKYILFIYTFIFNYIYIFYTFSKFKFVGNIFIDLFVLAVSSYPSFITWMLINME